MVKSVFFSQFSQSKRAMLTPTNPLPNKAPSPIQNSSTNLSLSHSPNHFVFPSSYKSPSISHYQLNPSFINSLPPKKRFFLKEASHTLAIEQASIKKFKFKQITPDFLQTWLALTPNEKKRITMKGFAESNNISINTLRNCVTARGNLLPYGKHILEKGGIFPNRKITTTEIRAWCGMTQKERDQMTLYEFAKSHHLNPSTLKIFVTQEGKVRTRGQRMLSKERMKKYRKINSHDIQTWCNLSQVERDKITMIQFAKTRGINQYTWQHCVTSKGVARPRGQNILDQSNPANTNAHTPKKIGQEPHIHPIIDCKQFDNHPADVSSEQSKDASHSIS